MDGEGDGDDAQLKLQRESGELIREFEGSLSRFLRKSTGMICFVNILQLFPLATLLIMFGGSY